MATARRPTLETAGRPGAVAVADPPYDGRGAAASYDLPPYGWSRRRRRRFKLSRTRSTAACVSVDADRLAARTLFWLGAVVPMVSPSTDAAVAEPPPTAPVGDGGSWRQVIGGRLLWVAAVAWVWSLSRFELDEMNDLGLVSIMPPSFFLALAVATVGFLFVNEHQAHRRHLVGGYLVLQAAMLHGTPAILYGTARYAWAHRHLGVVDFIQRNGGVASDAEFQQIHHAWPGLFSATVTLSEVTGISATTLATWAPLVFVLTALLALSIVFRCFVADPKVRSLALWLFLLGNWVGQELFGPQGFAFVLYLALLGLVLPFDRLHRDAPGRPELLDGGDYRPTDAGNVVVSVLGVLIVIAIVGSHQFTAIIVALTFGILSAFRLVRSAWVAAAAVGAALVWLIGPAHDYLQSDTADPADRVGLPAERPDAVAVVADISVGQAVVVIGGRFLTLGIVVLAIVGLVVLRRRPMQRVLVALTVSPLVLLLTGDRGEMIFRAYMFALPWLALAAAVALTSPLRPYPPATRVGLRALVVVVLLASFLFAYLGEERSHRFTADERQLAAWVAEAATPRTLLIEGSRNYPGMSSNEERFTFRALSRASADVIDDLESDPEGVLHGWMSDEQFESAFFMVTRSMRVEQRSVPSLPPGTLERVEAALVASPRFRAVQSNEDGVVFALVGEG